jgi:hypothetical protein
MFADAEADLRERVASLDADCRAYRMLAQQAVHALHELTVERDRLRDRVRQLCNEIRALRRSERRAA